MVVQASRKSLKRCADTPEVGPSRVVVGRVCLEETAKSFIPNSINPTSWISVTSKLAIYGAVRSVLINMAPPPRARGRGFALMTPGVHDFNKKRHYETKTFEFIFNTVN